MPTRNRFSAVQALTQWGHRVQTANEGQQYQCLDCKNEWEYLDLASGRPIIESCTGTKTMQEPDDIVDEEAAIKERHAPALVCQDGLPTDKAERKACPIFQGFIDYFPDAMAAVSNVSYVANQQHNPGEPMHWAKEKSTDHEDCIIRHLMDSGLIDDDGLRHSAKVAWRAMALLQIELEKAKEKNND